jgi:hypothetical protein
MNRGEFLAATAAATAAPSATPRPNAPPMAAIVTLQRDAPGLLSPFTIAIALDNSTKKNMILEFPTADLFRIDVLRDDVPVWSSLSGHKPIPINRRIDVPPGVLKLASMTVDGTTDDKRAYAPGKYTVRVAMLGTGFGAVVDKQIDFAPPTPIEEVLRSRPGTVFTIAGEQFVQNGYAQLRDNSGTLRLSRSLALRPSGIYVVRGFLDASGDERIFDVGRFAPAYDNGPNATP